MSDQFRRDLQAWTEARVSAILRHNITIKTARKPLAKAINGLLTDRIAQALDYLRGKAIPSEFLTGRSRTVPVPDFPYTASLDHGWCTGPYTATVIYTWSSLGSLLAAKGYTIGGSGEYNTTVTRTTSSTSLYPEDYSGLMKLAVQAFIGSGRDINLIKPTGWVLTNTKCGLVRSPDGIYWLANWGSGIGVKLAKLVIPESLQYLADALNAGLLSGENARVAEAMVIGQLTLSAPLESTVLFTTSSADFLAIYAAPPSSWGETTWGWCGRYQTRGESDEKLCGAVVLTINTGTDIDGDGNTYYYRGYRETVLSITFSSGVPSGTLTRISAGWCPPVPPDDKMWTIERYNGIQYNRRYAETLPTGDYPLEDPSSLGYLRSFYAMDGTIQRLALVGGYVKAGERTMTPDLTIWCPTYNGVNIQSRSKTYPAYQFSGNSISGIAERKYSASWEESWVLVGGGDPPNDYTTVSGSGSGWGYLIGTTLWYEQEGDIGHGPGVGTTTLGRVDVLIGGPGLVFFVAESGEKSFSSSFSWSVGEGTYPNLCDGTVYDTSAYLIIGDQVDLPGYIANLTSSETTQAKQVTICYDDQVMVQGLSSEIYTHLNTMIASQIVAYDSMAVSYGKNLNICGYIYPTGLNATGAELNGRFCGGS